MLRLFRIVQRLEDYLLAGLLGVMVVLASFLILLRNVFDTGIVWGEPVLRILVLWVALLGAVAASRGNNNISIEALPKILSPRLKLAARSVTGLFTSVVCAVIAWHGARFARMDYLDQIVAYGNVPAWLAELIIPLGFCLVGVRYLTMAVLDIRALVTKRNAE